MFEPKPISKDATQTALDRVERYRFAHRPCSRWPLAMLTATASDAALLAYRASS